MKLGPMNTNRLSRQAMIVAVAALMPVAVSLYKMRLLDAMVLILSGALAVYNVNCLTAGNCNLWATVVSVSFFVMTILQIMAPKEGMEGDEEETEGMEGEEKKEKMEKEKMEHEEMEGEEDDE